MMAPAVMSLAVAVCAVSVVSGTVVLSTNRQTATLDVISYDDSSYLLQGYDLNAQAFDGVQADFLSEGAGGGLDHTNQTDKLQPDVAWYDADNGYLYMAARGPRPVSAVKAQNFYNNAHPGVMALKIDTSTCLPADNQNETAFILTTLERSPEITSDVHRSARPSHGLCIRRRSAHTSAADNAALRRADIATN